MTAIAFRLVLLLGLALPASALAARSDWSQGDQMQMRLLLAAPGDARLSGGVEMLIEPGWHTYWRNPGEVGVAPQFDFSGSTNVASVEVLYPTPERYDDGTSVSLIYRDEVVFPLVITQLRPDRPTILRVSATFGVCSEVCIPSQASAELAVPPASESDPLAEARLAQFRPRVPSPPDPGRFDVETVTQMDAALLIDVRAPDSSYLDLFADPPKEWFIGQPQFLSRANGVSRYSLSLAGAPAGDAIRGATIRFVAVAGGEAIEKAVEIR